jgi:hypothetical protein
LTEEQELKLITLYPAIHLGILVRVGSIVVCKDADVAIWNGHPFSVYSRVDTTFVDGTVYFDRAQDLARRPELAKERAMLEQADPNKPPARGGQSPNTPRRRPTGHTDDDVDQQEDRP